jgi:hypothetical protein
LPGSIISITPKEIRSVRVSMRGKGARQAGRFQQSAPGSRHANTAIARNRWFGPRLARRIDRSISVVRADQTDSGRGQRGSSVLQSPPIHPPLSQASALHSLVVPIRGSRRREEVRALLVGGGGAMGSFEMSDRKSTYATPPHPHVPTALTLTPPPSCSRVVHGPVAWLSRAVYAWCRGRPDRDCLPV